MLPPFTPPASVTKNLRPTALARASEYSALYFMFYNFCRVHKTLRVTPAMEAGLVDQVWDVEELVALLPEPKPTKRGPYKKRISN
jgi:hypothetical protein